MVSGPAAVLAVRNFPTTPPTSTPATPESPVTVCSFKRTTKYMQR
jgi:hypothetical protein